MLPRVSWTDWKGGVTWILKFAKAAAIVFKNLCRMPQQRFLGEWRNVFYLSACTAQHSAGVDTFSAPAETFHLQSVKVCEREVLRHGQFAQLSDLLCHHKFPFSNLRWLWVWVSHCEKEPNILSVYFSCSLLAVYESPFMSHILRENVLFLGFFRNQGVMKYSWTILFHVVTEEP